MAAKPTSCMMAALEYADHGYPVVAIHGVRNGKCTCGNPECKSPGKHPIYDKNLQPHGPKSASTDAEKIHKLWTKYPFANVAIATGKASGIDVVDIDVKNGKSGADTIAEKAKELGQPVSKNTVRQMTGGGGWQLFYKYTGKIKGKARFAELLDSRSDGNYVVVPPSRHVSGKRYAWKEPLIGGTLAKMPEWMIEWIVGRNGGVGEQQGRNGHIDPSIVLSGVPEGARDETLFRYACSLRARGISREEAEVLVLIAAASCKPPYPEKDARKKVESAWRYENNEPPKKAGRTKIKKPPKDLGLTDVDNAKRFVKIHGERLRYCEEMGKWIVWDGKRWFQDGSGLTVAKMAMDVADEIKREAELMDGDDAITMLKFANTSSNLPRQNALVTLARSFLAVSSDDLDADDSILNCQNGVVNLRTGEMVPHNPAALCTRITNANYSPDALAHTWENFLDSIFEGDSELIDWIQKAVGYSATGHISEQCFFLCWGIGANGKSTFLSTLSEVLGDYATTTPFSTFLETNGTQPTNDLARLAGARFVSAIEADAARRISEATIKHITGGEKITARFLYQEYFEFLPRFSLWLACNHKPMIRGQDEGIWRRVRLIPFNRVFRPNERDRDLPRKLLEESDGILRWIVEGAMRWYREGLDEADAVCSATKEYQIEMDALGEFLWQRCLIDHRCRESCTTLYKEYVKWAEEAGEKPLSQRAFGLRMTEKGFKRIASGGRKYYEGIGLLENTTYEKEADYAGGGRHKGTGAVHV